MRSILMAICSLKPSFIVPIRQATSKAACRCQYQPIICWLCSVLASLQW